MAVLGLLRAHGGVVSTLRAKHAAGGDVAKTGEHLVQKFDEVAHVGYSWGDVKLEACMKHYSWLGAEIKKPRSAWLLWF